MYYYQGFKPEIWLTNHRFRPQQPILYWVIKRWNFHRKTPLKVALLPELYNCTIPSLYDLITNSRKFAWHLSITPLLITHYTFGNLISFVFHVSVVMIVLCRWKKHIVFGIRKKGNIKSHATMNNEQWHKRHIIPFTGFALIVFNLQFVCFVFVFWFVFTHEILIVRA